MKDDCSNETIETFFKDGNYDTSGTGIKSCTHPDGVVYNGTVTISSIYDCNNKKSFYQKNIVRETSHSIDTTRLTLLSFDINNIFLAMNNLGTSINGTYRIHNNKLVVHTIYGYQEPLGTNVKTKIICIKNDKGFSMKFYYMLPHKNKDNINKYKLFASQIYVYKS